MILTMKILDLVNKEHEYALTAFKSQLPEIEGDRNIMINYGPDPSNVMIVMNVSKDFQAAMAYFFAKKILSLKPCSFLESSHDGGEIYNLPIAKSYGRDYKSLRWLPVMIGKGPYFNEGISEITDII